MKPSLQRWMSFAASVAGAAIVPLTASAQGAGTAPRYEEGLLRIESLAPAADGSTSSAAPGTVGSAAPAAPAALVGVPPTAAARASAVDALRRGIELAHGNDPTRAVAEFDRAAGLAPIIGDWADLLAARALAARGDVAGTIRRVERIAPEGAGEWAWRAAFDATIAARDSAGAISVAERAASVSATASERALANAHAGRVRAARGDSGGALAAYLTAMRESPSSPGGLDAARGAHDLPGLTPSDRLLVGRTLIAHGGRDRGIPLLEAFASSSVASEVERAAVRLEVGTVLFNARDYERAERNLRPAAEVLPAAGYLLGRTDYRLGRQEQGIRRFQDVARRFPDTEAAADAYFVLGDLAHDEGRVVAATGYYRQAIATGAHTVAATDAAVRLAGIGLMADDPARARSDLTDYLATRPRDRTSAPAIYWMGRVNDAMGMSAEARARYREVFEMHPFSYYGMLSARRLGMTLADVPVGDPPPVGPHVEAAIETAFFRMDVLREVGLATEAGLELARLQEIVEDDAGALYAIAEAMSEHGEPVAGALLGRRIQDASGDWDDRLLRIVFQFPYQDLVVREATRNGLDPYAVAGLIRQESFFNPVAESAAGAVGLMQVMPSTATGLARRAGVSGFNARMLRDPATNLRLGSLYLADQMARWNGRLSDVLGAYNGGPTRVARWSSFPEHADDEIYIERIPIAETRDYVKRVTLYGEIYRRLYDTSSNLSR